jgi:hypothetical protein
MMITLPQGGTPEKDSPHLSGATQPRDDHDPAELFHEVHAPSSLTTLVTNASLSLAGMLEPMAKWAASSRVSHTVCVGPQHPRRFITSHRHAPKGAKRVMAAGRHTDIWWPHLLMYVCVPTRKAYRESSCVT